MCFETSHLDDQHCDKSAFMWGLSASSLQNPLAQGSRWGTDTNSTFSSCPLTLSVLFSDTFSPFFLLPAVQGDLSALSWKPSVRAAPCLRPTYSQQLTAQRLGGSCRKQSTSSTMALRYRAAKGSSVWVAWHLQAFALCLVCLCSHVCPFILCIST